MADLHRMDRTWLCSVLFMDIVSYSTQSVEQQMKWKTRFNSFLAEAIQDVPKDERVILDTGDGAAVCFLGSPEAAMFAALHLWQCFVRDEREQKPGLRVRMGVNLGPVKLVKDLNGSLNAIGDGINAGQRIMSFAQENQILVSQSFFDVVHRLSDDYKKLFRLKGVETDKHVREHTVYSLLPPGSEERQATATAQNAQQTKQGSDQPRPASAPAAAYVPNVPKQRGPALAVAVSALAVMLAAFGMWRFAGSAENKSQSPSAAQPASSVPAPQNASPPPESSKPQPVTQTAPTPESSPRSAERNAPPVKQPGIPVAPSKNSEPLPLPAPQPVQTTQPRQVAVEPKMTSASPPTEPKVRPGENVAAGQPAKPQLPPGRNTSPAVQSPDAAVPAAALSAYNQGMQLIEQQKPAEGIKYLDQALRAYPQYMNAYLGRAGALRMQSKFEASIDDCNRAMKVWPGEARPYFCRGLSEGALKQFDLAVRDYTEAARRNPNFELAWEMRGSAHISLQKYELAVQDLNRAIELTPKDPQPYLRRALAHQNLKRYRKAIEDYDEVIRLQPRNVGAYVGRAEAKDLAGDSKGAEADRREAKQLRGQ